MSSDLSASNPSKHDSDESDSVDLQNLEKLTVSVLRTELELRGLSKTGRKADLIRRLQTAIDEFDDMNIEDEDAFNSEDEAQFGRFFLKSEDGSANDQDVDASADGGGVGGKGSRSERGPQSATGPPQSPWGSSAARLHCVSNEQYVDDVTISFLYEPHNFILLGAFFAALVYHAFPQPGMAERSTEYNIGAGLAGVSLCFVTLSAAVMPSGPFIRPHPLVWRLVLGVFCLYWLSMAFLLFQPRDDVMRYLRYLDPLRLPMEEPPNRFELAADPNAVCDFTYANIVGNIDIFCMGHFGGWVVKALVIRSSTVCWLCSIMWELTEVLFVKLLPNFAECWWDQLIFDVLVCNGLGIAVGTSLCTYFEGKTYSWEGIRSIKGAKGKAKRALLQFTPASWTVMIWDPLKSVKRYAALVGFVLNLMALELNTFFLKVGPLF